jgi:urease beta subunit
VIPGEIRVGGDELELNAGRERQEVVIVNAGDRPIQVGSHLHLPDANPALQFDREATQGFRLDVPAGTSVRLEPGVSRKVTVVRLGGRGYVPGAQLGGRAQQRPSAREPRHVVPFGTPGVPVEPPSTATHRSVRLSEEPDDARDTGEQEDAP